MGIQFLLVGLKIGQIFWGGVFLSLAWFLVDYSEKQSVTLLKIAV